MLQERVAALAGLSLSQCAARIGLSVPSSQKRQKGWIGNLMEKALGADAKCLPIPDFSKLGIELKTLPIGKNGKPTESTFVSSIALKNIQKETWPTSTVFRKLSHVLWIPIEDDVNLPLSHRRIGQGFLWRPSKSQESLLEKDWNELSDLIVFGDFESITARLGEALQIRPKAATGTSLTKAFDDSGTLIQTLPRGFYLRSRFTASLLK
jgi:DNA mismatch repair protein MutH